MELGAYDRFSAWRLGVLLWRSLYSLYSVLGKAWRALWKAAPPQRGRDPSTRQIHEEGVLRLLDPDSESETGVVVNPCEAERVGLILQGRQHALAPEGCQDRASQDPTRLLDEDRHLSDLGGRDVTALCNHHSQLYVLACQGRKCRVLSCCATSSGARNGDPFCRKHLTEAASSTPNKRQSNNSLSSALWAAAAKHPGGVQATRDESIDRKVSKSDDHMLAMPLLEPQLGRGLLRLHHLQQRSKSTVLKKWKGPRGPFWCGCALSSALEFPGAATSTRASLGLALGLRLTPPSTGCLPDGWRSISTPIWKLQASQSRQFA